MTRGVCQYCGRVCTHVLHGYGVQDTGKALPRPLPQLVGCSQPPPSPPSPSLQLDAQAAGGGGGAGLRLIGGDVMKDMEGVRGQGGC